MKNLLPLLIIVFSLNVFGQVAIIKDKDGFTNVRKSPNGQSEIIYRLLENKVFWFDFEQNADTSNWISVYIPKNNYSFDCSDPNYIQGFIHKSRLLPLDNMEIYDKPDFYFCYFLQPFDSTNRIIEKQDMKWVIRIDGSPVWGTDGEMPKTEIKNIDVKFKEKRIDINKAFYNNLFECKNEFKIYKNGDTFFVYQSNSDGAGYYEVVWVIGEDGLKQRLVGNMY